MCVCVGGYPSSVVSFGTTCTFGEASSERDVQPTSRQFRLFCDRYKTQILTGKMASDVNGNTDEHELSCDPG